MRRKVLMQLCILIATLSLLAIFGAVGGLENGLMSFWTSLVIGFIALMLFGAFTQAAINLDYGIKKEHHGRQSVSAHSKKYFTLNVPQTAQFVNRNRRTTWL